MDNHPKQTSKTDCEEVGMLAPYRVLDLTDERGQYAGQLLGSLGSDVIKIEKPGGDPARNIGPFFLETSDPQRSLFWMAYNNNKRGITLDITSPQGKEIFETLVGTADVILESYKPGYLENIGLGYKELRSANPDIILTSITPFGQSGPYSNFKAEDIVCWAMGGLLSQSGDPDYPPVSISHIPFSYLIASCDAAWATAAAIFWRGSSGRGQWIDVSIQASVLLSSHNPLEGWKITGKENPRGSTFSPLPGTDAKLRVQWQARDGYVRYRTYPGSFGKDENERMLKWLEEERIADDFIRSINWATFDWTGRTQEEVDRIQSYISRLFQSKTRAELAEEGRRRNIMVEPVSTPVDVFKHPQLEARGYWQEVFYPELGASMAHPSRSFLPSGTACKVWRKAPLIGEHNKEIYQEELGFSASRLQTLQASGII